ncbi:hypothetical protein ACOSP6_12145 [Tenacibaculum sp. MEBiC06402]|uniref:hypothetical protein n=1 Tax=unclassified Tenacibaculum TaxID=2635139 RepID=UPI003B99C333
MELNKEQIKKIDSFLEAIGVEYIDIRFEMVDHIATEIEEKINDVDSFFKEDGFQTPFLKYMLSKQQSLMTKYDSQIKKLNWYYFKDLCKGVIKLIFNPKVLTIISLLIFLVLQFGNTYSKEISILFFVLITITSAYAAYYFLNFEKKFKEIKFVDFYIKLNLFILGVQIILPNFSNRFFMYLGLANLIANIFVNLNLFAKKEMIEKKYGFLIE